MNSRLIYAAFWLIFGFWSLYDWRKNKDKDLLWFIGFGIVGFLTECVHYYLIAASASQSILSGTDLFDRIINIIMAIGIVLIGIRYYARKNKQRRK
jgi:hypothetical protein